MHSRILKRIAIIAAWLTIWQLAAFLIGNRHLLCGPVSVVEALCALALKPSFWISIGWSFARIGLGFLCAVVLGSVLGAVASRSKTFADALEPPVHVIKSAPVVCIIALLLVIFGSGMTTSIVVAMVVFPPIYFAIISAHKSRSTALEELARTFAVPPARKVFYIELPQYRPLIEAALKTTVGMSWKAGVAAEIIGLPGMSIGEAVYLSKLTLDMPAIIAWTAVVIVLGWVCEKIVLALVNAAFQLPKHSLDRHVEAALNTGAKGAADLQHSQRERTSSGHTGSNIEVVAVSKAFGDVDVLDGFSMRIASGDRVCIMAPSGTGKTTLLRIVAGMEQSDSGRVDADTAPSTVSQLSRLIEAFTASENLAVVAKDASELAHGLELLGLLIPDASSWEGKPVSELSGGMRRRVELARALAHPSGTVILDEPFAGLDNAARRNAASILLDSLCDRTLIVATHDAHDAELLDAEIVRLQ